MLFDAVRAHAGIALWPTGVRTLANFQRLIDMARHFEGRASSFRAFVERLEADAERGEADKAPIIKEGTEGIRVIDRAQGQWPGIPSSHPRRPDVQRDPRMQTLAVLEALMDCPRDRLSGAQIARTTKLASGTLYPILARLEEAGWLERVGD